MIHLAISLMFFPPVLSYFIGQPKRHLLTTGWSMFVGAKRLRAGDSVLFIRYCKNKVMKVAASWIIQCWEICAYKNSNILIVSKQESIRYVVYFEFYCCRDEKSQLLLGVRRANRQQTSLPSSVLSADSMHIGVLAAAAHAAANRSTFTIFYNPRYVYNGSFHFHTSHSCEICL